VPPATTVVPATTAPPATTVPCRTVEAIPVGLGVEPPASLDVRRGDCGPGVQQVQQLLRDRWGYTIAADGQFGPATDAAVRDFQTNVMGVAADGLVGPITWVALNSDDFDPSGA
jgi:peptidoglycan hydrolase-like protein with peptidoglycan-binding domain